MIQNRDVIFGELFHDVQMSGIFEDSKTFVDCVPKKSTDEILTAYKHSKDLNEFDLLTFVGKYFNLPPNLNSGFKTNPKNTAIEHVTALWDVLKREADQNNEGSIIPLQYSYIVPGGRFREIYYWDSYFTMLGLIQSNQLKMIQNMLKNFGGMIELLGFIPNGNRSYFNSRSQPPFFGLMIDLLQKQGENVDQFIPTLEKEYAFWMSGERAIEVNGTTINRYWDNNPIARQESYKEDMELSINNPTIDAGHLFLNIRAACESGWDFSSRWLASTNDLASIRTTEIIPVDLNSILFFTEKLLGKEEAAQKRSNWINTNCWNESLGYYMDYDVVNKAQCTGHTLAGVFPLFFNIANQNQAEKCGAYISKHLLKPGGLVTTTLNTGQQWDAPNGWAPLQWMAIKGLENYNQIDLAKEIAIRWCKLNEAVFSQTGKFVEKYNVCDLSLEAGGGEYPVQDGFGWSNGVYIKLKDWLSKN